MLNLFEICVILHRDEKNRPEIENTTRGRQRGIAVWFKKGTKNQARRETVQVEEYWRMRQAEHRSDLEER